MPKTLITALLLSLAPTVHASFYAEYMQYPKAIRINTFSERLSYYEFGKKMRTFVVSTGDEGHPTPLGRFRIISKNERMLSKSAGVYMPYWMEFLDGKYGIHALPENAQGELATTAAIGDEAGGGCVRLSKQDAEKLYTWAEPGTVVLTGYDVEEYASPVKDVDVIRKYFRLINASDYAGAYALRANRKIPLEEFEEMYR
ncbi:MAG: L,D-transpeptidase, partial [Patescibacteria group bacterium]